MAEDRDPNREQGVEFGDLAERLERVDYPISNAVLVELHGDEELVLADGSTTLATTLGDMSDTVYEDVDQVRQAVFNMVTDEAIGRKSYTDREPTVDFRFKEYDESF